MKTLSNIEKAIDNCINRQVKKLNKMTVDEYIESRNPHLHDPRAKYIIENIHNIYSNTSSLLTHVSAMIASLGIILIVFSNSKWTQLIIFAEMIFYSIFAIACVYSLKIPGLVPKRHADNIEEYIEKQYQFYLNRRYIYQVSLIGIIITTIFFVITIIVHTIAGLLVEEASISAKSSIN